MNNCLVIKDTSDCIESVYEVNETKTDIKKALEDSSKFQVFTKEALKPLKEATSVGSISDVAQTLLDGNF